MVSKDFRNDPLLTEARTPCGRNEQYLADSAVLTDSAVPGWLSSTGLTQQYLADATPNYGKDNLKDFFRKPVLEGDGLKGQELGDAAVL
jgi:hypothetical protein